MSLSIGAALVRDGVVRVLRRALPHTNLISGVLLLVVSAYLIDYWGLALFASPEARAGDPVITFMQRAASLAETWLNSGGGQWLLIGAAAVVVLGLLATLWQWASRSDDDISKEDRHRLNRPLDGAEPSPASKPAPPADRVQGDTSSPSRHT